MPGPCRSKCGQINGQGPRSILQYDFKFILVIIKGGS